MQKIGRYEIISQIGKGAMGVVYLAKDPVIDRVLAIKTIRLIGLAKEEGEEFLKRFYQEAKAAGGLSHPNIVTIHDAGFDQELEMHYIVMEYIPGKTLKEIIQQKVPLDFKEKAIILEKIADGIAYAHSKGIIHRDIKPANIIISGPDNIKITDFGIAKLPASQLTTDGQYLGTPSYMSPEQVLGRPVDARSDIFSFGIVAYELLAYQKPFTGSNLTEVSHSIAYENHKPLQELVPNCPKVLLYIVDKCLSKDPLLRFQNAKEISKELKNFILIPEEEKKDEEATVVYKEKIPEKKEDFETVIQEKPQKKSLRGKIIDFFKRKKSLQFLSYQIYLRWVLLIIFAWLFGWLSLMGFIFLKSEKIKPKEVSYTFVNPMELKQLIIKGKAFLKENQYERALSFFEKALLINPTSPYLIKEVQGIRTFLDSKLRAEDENYQIKFYLEMGEEALRKKDYLSAKVYFQNLLMIDPENIDAKNYLKKIEEFKKEKKPIVVPEKTKEEMAKKEEIKKEEVVEKKEAKISEPKMEVRFKSPIPEGIFLVSLNGKQIIKKTFNFFVSVGFMKKEFKGGSIEAPIPIKVGSHNLQVWITKPGKDGYTAYQKIDLNIKPSIFYIINLILDDKAKSLDYQMEEKEIGN